MGDPTIQLLDTLAGVTLDRMAEEEESARSDEVLADTATIELAGKSVRVSETRTVVESGNTYSVVTGIGAPSSALVTKAAGVLRNAKERLRPWLLPAVFEQLTRGTGDFLTELRPAIAMFVRFGGISFDEDDAAGQKLDAYVRWVQKVLNEYGGALIQLTIGDKGSNLYIAFGAPVAHEDDARRAVSAAHELRSLPFNLDFIQETRIGISMGAMRTGPSGGASRKTYAVLGKEVNLAARLMDQARPEQILVTGRVREAVALDFDFHAHPAINVKGISTPVSVFSAGSPIRNPVRRGGAKYSLPMVGREEDLEWACEAMERAMSGSGLVAGITAEAGVGKSRLCAEIMNEAINRGFLVLYGACQPYGRTADYVGWHAIWRAFFGVDNTRSRDEQLEQLSSTLRSFDDRLAERMPLLDRALNMSISDNALTSSITGWLRKTSRESLLATCLQHRAESQPILLVLEDCHWIDPSSLDLLEAVSRPVVDLPVFVLALYRPATGQGNPIGDVALLDHFEERRLHEFSAQETERLIELKVERLFGSRAVSQIFVEEIARLAQGNPFYIDEMLNYVYDEGFGPAAPDDGIGWDLPDSLRSLIISRIDHLQEEQKNTIKVASVIGQSFAPPWLWGSYPDLGSPDQVMGRLRVLTQLDLVQPSLSEPQPEYLFKHVLTREITYESLATDTRFALHERIASFIEREYVDSMDQYLDLLAHHYGESRNMEKKKEYLRRAAHAAQEAYANHAAIPYYQALLPLVSVSERVEIMVRMGEVWEVTSEWAKAEDVLREALALAEKLGDRRLLAECRFGLGYLLNREGQFAEALCLLQDSRREFEAFGDEQMTAKVVGAIGDLFWQQGDYQKALVHIHQQLDTATRLDDRRGMAAAYGNIGIIYTEQGNYDQAIEYLKRDAEISEEAGDRRGASMAVGNLGNCYYFLKDYGRAMACLQERLRVASEIGDQRGVGIVVGNIGSIYDDLGEYAGSNACSRAKLQIALEIGDMRSIPMALGNLGRTTMSQGNLEKAREFLCGAIEIDRALNLTSFLCEDLFSFALLCRRADRLQEAKASVDEAWELANEIGRKNTLFMLALLDVRVSVDLGQCTRDEAILRLRAMREKWSEEEQIAYVQLELWRLDPAEESIRLGAAARFKKLYQVTHFMEYRTRYEELTGVRLLDPPALPDLPPVVTERPKPIDLLLRRVDAVIKSLHAGHDQP